MAKRRGRTRRASAAALLETPPATPPPDDTPKSVIYQRKDKEARKTSSPDQNTDVAKNRATAGLASSSGLFKSPARNSLSTIADLKDLASSHLLELKRHIDHSHSQITKDVNSSLSRLHKRFKIQSEACQKTMDEAEKDYQKMSRRILDSQEAMKASYDEFLAHEQETASRACKAPLAELSQSFERSVDALRSRFGISST